MSAAAARVWIVDDDPAVRESLEALLASAGFEAESFGSAKDFLEVFEPARAACLLLDVRMPEMDGLTLLEALGAADRRVPVIMMTAHGDVTMAVRAMRAGAHDFVEKPYQPERLISSVEQAIRAVDRAPAPGGPAEVAAEADAAHAPFGRLTPRETEVMRQMVIGHPNKIIAHNLGLSPRTVEIHRGRVMQKTGAESLSHLVRMAIRAGYDPDRG